MWFCGISLELYFVSFPCDQIKVWLRSFLIWVIDNYIEVGFCSIHANNIPNDDVPAMTYWHALIIYAINITNWCQKINTEDTITTTNDSTAIVALNTSFLIFSATTKKREGFGGNEKRDQGVSWCFGDFIYVRESRTWRFKRPFSMDSISFLVLLSIYGHLD